MQRTDATRSCQDARNRAVTATKVTRYRVKRLAFLPAIPHQGFVCFGVIDSRSVLHNQHPPLYS